ncbi:amidohydrolase family protein [Enterovibrio sp. ZSDZ42]|uniref:Amidohydrolase family protein n=1 Tax=Enterovibrio gelatinilyticus TaxID=2899819 RepID=A0ABT5R4N7_9GAMM|nr:amidohydrolase family protein [Enterovibrio sp. ZSDZ42]MDD1794954.1 amidohydrolase family protein [Enterovibrio sp. ZSDZ42]
MEIIDAHLHLFDLQHGHYDWVRDGNPPFWPDKSMICQNWSESDLTLSNPQQLSGIVHIEAGFDNAQPWREIAWLEEAVSLPLRSIGCVDLTLSRSAFLKQVSALCRYNSVVGVRHILDDDAEVLLSDENVKSNLQVIADTNLIFEAQFDGDNTAAMTTFLSVIENIPNLIVAFNHAGFAPSKNRNIWAHNLQRLAKKPNVYIKASGWEMVERQYESKIISERIGELLAWFGEDRVMLASNFPLCQFRSSYRDLWNEYAQLPITEDIKLKLRFSNAQRFYRF